MKKHLFLFLINILFFQIIVSAQLANVGTWTDYTSYQRGRELALAGDKIYCLTMGNIFSYGLNDNSIEKLSKNNFLSEVNPQTMAYSDKHKVLIVAYRNSVIDIVSESETLMLTDVKRANITGSKKINSIYIEDDIAYLSCDFGIVLLDIAKQEIRDTYYIGTSVKKYAINEITLNSQNIYAATENGVFKADRNNPLLADYNNWEKITCFENANQSIEHIAYFNDYLFVVDTVDNNVLKIKDNTSDIFAKIWWRGISKIKSTEDYLILVAGGSTQVFDKKLNIIHKTSTYTWDENIFNNDAIFLNNNLWIADTYNTLIKHQQNGNAERIIPNSPHSNLSYKITLINGNLWIATGGWNTWEQAEINYQENGVWKKIDTEFKRDIGTEENKNKIAQNIFDIAVDPKNKNKVYASSFFNGLYEIENGKVINHYQENYGLNLSTNESYQVGSIAFDEEGNLWIVNLFRKDKKQLVVKRTDGTWESFKCNSQTEGASLAITSDNHKWTGGSSDQKLFIIDENEETWYDAVKTSSNDEISKRVWAITEDLDGAVWVGTDGGIAVYQNPSSAIEEPNNFYADRIIKEVNGIGTSLLGNERITSISIDGGNRKWVGSNGSGVYLFSPDCKEELLNFTAENSPLPSNQINDIEINQETGEIFISTGAGLVSYRGTSIKGGDDFGDVYAYPNPVRPDYSGDIIITGLIRDTEVKITDITGSVVFETKSEGGQAVWNGTNGHGDKVKTGIYLVFCANEDGTKTAVTKILFIN